MHLAKITHLNMHFRVAFVVSVRILKQCDVDLHSSLVHDDCVGV